MKKQLNFILLCLCFALTSHAQQQFSIPNADAIGFSRDRYEVMVYTKIGEQRYIQKRLNLDIKKTKDNDYPKKLLVNWKLFSDEDTLTLNNIEAQNEVFYEVNDLQSTPLNTFMGKSFVVHDNKKWRRDAEDYQAVYEALCKVATDDSILILEGINDNKDTKAFWKRVQESQKATRTYDLFLCGIIVFDTSKHKHHYIVNF